MARVINQGSRLSAVRLAKHLSVSQLFDMNELTEDKLYSNMNWISDNQVEIEDALFRFRYKNEKPSLYLY